MSPFALSAPWTVPDLAGRVAVVTGASRGIGRAFAQSLLDAGAEVWGLATTAESFETVPRLDHPAFHPWVADQADERAMSDLAESVACAAGRLDLLVNNAAILGPRTWLRDTPIRAADEVLRTNVLGVMSVTKSMWPLLFRTGDALVVNLSSGVGRRGRAGWGAYAASKFAIEGLTQVWAEEGAPRVRVVALNPGATRTAMRAAAAPDEDPSTVPPPEDVARALLALCSEEAAKGDISGRTFDAREVGRRVE